MLGILSHNFHVQTGTVFDRKSFIIKLSQEIDIFIIDFSDRDGKNSFGGLGHRLKWEN